MAPGNIPERASVTKPSYVNPAVEAVNAKADRERYYALLRERSAVRRRQICCKSQFQFPFQGNFDGAFTDGDRAGQSGGFRAGKTAQTQGKAIGAYGGTQPISLKAWEYPKVG